MNTRDRILARVRTALKGVPEAALPPVPASEVPDPLELFKARLAAAGAEVAILPDLAAARHWLEELLKAKTRVWCSPRLPEALACRGGAAPEEAEAAVSWALAAAAETGSVLLPASEGRSGQLLAPVHVVLVEESRLYPTLLEALKAARGAGEAAIGLHSGPSKSADIGQIMVKGVHGPGELWVGVVGAEAGPDGLRAALGGLIGKTLRTKRGEPFLVEAVGARSVRVRTRGGAGKALEVPLDYLERAVTLAKAGADLSGPSRLRREVGDRAAAYAWAILHALGYV